MTASDHCFVCKAGLMKTTGKVLTSFPPKEVFKCDNCGHTTQVVLSGLGRGAPQNHPWRRWLGDPSLERMKAK